MRNKIREFTTRTNFFGVLLPFFLFVGRSIVDGVALRSQLAFARQRILRIGVGCRVRRALLQIILIFYSWHFLVVAARVVNLIFLRTAVSFYEVPEHY